MNAEEILEQVATIARNITQCGPVKIERTTKAVDVRGWDSLSQTMILLEIEEHFGVQVSIEESMKLENVGALADMVSRLIDAKASGK